MNSLYVYYRVDAAASDSAREAVTAILSQVEARTGIQGRLMQRADDVTTWMEIYEDVGDAVRFRRILDEAASHATPGIFVSDKRHIEHFRDDREGLASQG